MYEKSNNLKTKILSIFSDPVLIYTSLIMMSVMYHYHSSFTFVYGLITAVSGAVVFKFFDYMQKHQLVGSLGYIALFSAFMYLSAKAVREGAETYPLNFMVWFLTPQDALDFSQWYTIAIFLLFLIFMLSVVYYFTKVRYRVFMGFLIFIIPFTIYGKEYEKMPVAFIILLSVAYILIMVKYRQLKDSDSVEIVSGKETWKSIAVYAVIFATVSAVVPKPFINADRTVLETLISAEQFTDKLLAMLNVFQDTSSGDQFRNMTSQVPLYFVNSGEPLTFRTKSYTSYNYSNDSWSVSDNDRADILPYHTRSSVDISETGSLTQSILLASSLDSEFAEKYGLEKFSDINMLPSRTVKVYSVISDTQSAPVPPFALKLRDTSYAEDLALTNTGVLYANGNYKQRFGYNESFTFAYTPGSFLADRSNYELISLLSSYDCLELLDDALNALSSSAEYSDDWERVMNEYADYIDLYEQLTDYGDNQKIRELAEKLTKDCSNDYERAKVLESYFYLNNYNYDLTYQKSKGENAEDFIFNTKRGVCYEYATSMVLLARSLGIPARYCEGYNMSTQYANNRMNTNYIITGNDAHGFPELYISGFGWVPFEPTITNESEQENQDTATSTLAKAGIAIFVTAVLFLLGILLYPVVSHKIFIFRYRRKSPNDTVNAVMHRICRIYRIENVYTSSEASELVQKISGADISEVAVLFDRAVYGEAVLSEKDKEKVMEVYITAYQMLKDMKKSREQIKNN